MESLVAFNLVHDVMRQQFQTQPLHREATPSRLRWHIGRIALTRPLAAALRSAAYALDGGVEQPVVLVRS